jgi:hypothetical protein
MYFGPQQAYTLTIKTRGQLPVVINMPAGLQLEIRGDHAPSATQLPIVYRGNVFLRARRFVPEITNDIQRIDIGEYNLALALKDAEVEIALAGSTP